VPSMLCSRSLDFVYSILVQHRPVYGRPCSSEAHSAMDFFFGGNSRPPTLRRYQGMIAVGRRCTDIATGESKYFGIIIVWNDSVSSYAIIVFIALRRCKSNLKGQSPFLSYISLPVDRKLKRCFLQMPPKPYPFLIASCPALHFLQPMSPTLTSLWS
jgi:hypothetical protein